MESLQVKTYIVCGAKVHKAGPGTGPESVASAAASFKQCQIGARTCLVTHFCSRECSLRPESFSCNSHSRVFCAESFAREVRALAVTVYFGSAALLWAADSPHLAVVMVHLNVLESVLALKIKALNDSVAKAVQQLQNMQLQFALLVSSSSPAWL